MLRVSLRQILAATLVAGMAILVIVPILLSIAIQQRTIAPPQLDVRLGGLHLVGYVTHMPDCDRYVTPCQPELMAPPAQDFDVYVIWILTRTGQRAPADEWQGGTRLLTLPLRNQFNGSRDVLIMMMEDGLGDRASASSALLLGRSGGRLGTLWVPPPHHHHLCQSNTRLSNARSAV